MAVKSSDQITIADLTDGYSIMLSMDAITLNGDVSTLGTAQNVTIIVSAYKGGSKVVPTVGTPTCPTNVTASIGTASDSAIPVTITFGAALAASGKVVLPVSIDDITINKEFAFSIAFKGTPGATGQTGAAGADAYTVVLTNENHTFAGSTSAALAGSAECSVVAYKGGTQVAATIGTISGAPTGMSTSISNNGSTSAKFTVTVTTAMVTKNGVLTIPVTVDGKTFSMRFTYSLALAGATGATGATGQTGATGATGQTGAAGADAITLVITTSAGNIFKNNNGSTILTAHVYKAGTEVTGTALTALGSIKWYKDGGSTAVATGTTLTVSASDVTGKAVYEARLEG